MTGVKPAALRAASVAGPRTVPAEALDILAAIAAREAGLLIGPDKSDFLIARLQGQVARLGLGDLTAYARHLAVPAHGLDRRHFVEALTTHTTSFFRETRQFDWLLAEGLGRLAARGVGRDRPLDVWSAACSSGQELYSALMALAAADLGGGRAPRIAGLGTDLSRPVLRRAERAIYSREEIAGIPEALRRRFLLVARGDPDCFRVAPDLRRLAQWRRANLTEGSSLAGLDVDVAFLRNVLIYFDGATKDRVLRNVLARLRGGGYLLTGHSEAIDWARYGLRALGPSIYEKES